MRKNQEQVGRCVVVDKRICHGQPIFARTRVLVADVLEQVAISIASKAIVEELRGEVGHEAITEVVRIAL